MTAWENMSLLERLEAAYDTENGYELALDEVEEILRLMGRL